MKFMMMVKASEQAGPPPMALMQAIGQLGEEAVKAGVLVEMGGLLPTAMGVRVRASKGKVSVMDGPFSEAKEVVGGYAVYELPSRAEAIQWCRRFMELHVQHWPEFEGESEIRQISGPGDMPG